MGKQSGGIMPWDSLVNFTSNMIDLGVNTAQQNKWNKQQQKNWEQQFQYQKDLNNLMMQREDTAVQRKARDLQAAGFNKLLAATGEAAPVSGMTTFGGQAGGNANKINIDKITPFREIMELKQMNENIQLTKAERDLKEKQAGETDSKTNLNNSLINLNNSITENNKIKATQELIMTLRYYNDWRIETSGNIKSNDTSTPNNLYSAIALGIKLFAKNFGIDLYSGEDGNELKNELNNMEKGHNNNQFHIKDYLEELNDIDWDKLEKEGRTTEGILKAIKLIILGPKKRR